MRREHIELSDHKCLLTSSKINGICQCNCRVLLRPVDETPFGQDKSINMTCRCDCTSKSTNKIGRLSFYPCFEILFRLNIVLWQYVTVLYNYVSISSSLDYTWWKIIHTKTMGVLAHCHHIPISSHITTSPVDRWWSSQCRTDEAFPSMNQTHIQLGCQPKNRTTIMWCICSVYIIIYIYVVVLRFWIVKYQLMKSITNHVNHVIHWLLREM
jgi:hypothetical protein